MERVKFRSPIFACFSPSYTMVITYIRVHPQQKCIDKREIVRLVDRVNDPDGSSLTTAETSV